MRHGAYSQAASRPGGAWAAHPLTSTTGSATPTGSSAYPPLGAQPSHQVPPHIHSSHHGAASDPAGVSSVSTLLDRVLAMLDGFEDDMDCPLCLEEMDLSDLNFRPCPCGYQICRFCYHHIKENLNNKCPACRTPYDDATVEFKAIKPDEMKRLQAAKKLRDKRRKDSELAMQNKANVRVRQRTQVQITGMTTRQANEDTLAQLKDNEHFGKYGKISRLFMSKRSPTSGSAPGLSHPVYQPVSVYVCYRTPTEASHCIAATDGTLSLEGNKLRAMWGTTRYCPNYLKGIRCPDYNCTFAHEPGEEIEGPLPSTKDEIFTYDSETVSKPKAAAPSSAAVKKAPEVSLPASASWASKNAPPQPTTPIILNPHLPPLSATLPKPPPPRLAVPKPQTHPLPARPSSRAKQAAAAAAAAAAATAAAAASSSSASGSGSASTSTSASSAAAAAAAAAAALASPSTSAPQTPTVELKEEEAFEEHDVALPEEPVASTSRSPSPRAASPPVPVAPAPFDPFAAFTAQFANAGYGAPAFDVPSFPSFPDLEFGGESAFSFNLDVKGKGRAAPPAQQQQADESTPFRDFGNLGGHLAETPSSASASASSYMGSFDPFAENAFSGSSADLRSESPSPPSTAEDLSRRSSRFGFARRSSSSAGPSLSLAALRDGMANGLTSPAAPFAPPGIGLPPRAGSYNGVGAPPDWASGGGTPGMAPAFPPGVLRSLASPSVSASSSPQLSPRARATLPHGYAPPPPGLGGINGVANSALPPPPGLMQGRGAPIPAASFPLPPPAPRAGGASSSSSTVAKEDLLALIAAAQASAPKQHPQHQGQHQQHQQPMQAPSQEPHPFFSDPAILNARLASAPANAPLPPPPSMGQAYGQQQQQSPFPPGMRLPFDLQQQQQAHQQQQQQQQQHPGMYRQMGGQHGRV